MKFFDLFCGVGGFRLGLERNGHECVGACEIDEYARKTYAKNFGHEPEYKDARNIKPRELPDFDILAAGFPCQAFSVAGKLLVFKEARGTLFFEIARIAREKKPQLLFLENVRNILSHDKGWTFRTILNTLDEIGYDTQWILINSKFFVPQNRERVYFIGHLRNGRGSEVFPIGTSDTVDIEACNKA